MPKLIAVHAFVPGEQAQGRLTELGSQQVARAARDYHRIGKQPILAVLGPEAILDETVRSVYDGLGVDGNVRCEIRSTLGREAHGRFPGLAVLRRQPRPQAFMVESLLLTDEGCRAHAFMRATVETVGLAAKQLFEGEARKDRWLSRVDTLSVVLVGWRYFVELATTQPDATPCFGPGGSITYWLQPNRAGMKLVGSTWHRAIPVEDLRLVTSER